MEMPSNPRPTCIQCGDALPAGVTSGCCQKCLLTIALNQSPAATDSPDLSAVILKTRPPEEVQLYHVGDYELIEEVARGGMGVVFLAQQVSVRRLVALKFILKQRLDSEAARRRFRQEAEATARLAHPNIVPIYEAGEHAGHLYLSMRYVEGRTLAHQLNGQSSSAVFDCASVLAKIARAVHYAHERGVLHRDLKPSNILLEHTGEPYVTDFGLAKIAGLDHAQRPSSVVVGTPHYMAPEQCVGGKGDVSTASDVFSLGVILYEILSGRTPFEGVTSLEVMRQIAEDPPPALTLDSSKRDLGIICMKCLEKDPSQRYQSALALAEDLERYDCGEPIHARPVGALERTVLWIKRKPTLAILIATTALVMVVGTAVSLWQAHQAKAAQVSLAANLYAADMARAFQLVADGRLTVARALLAKHLPLHDAIDHRGWEWRWLWAETAPNHTKLFAGHQLPAISIAISPDEKTMATGCENGEVILWDVASGESEVLVKNENTRVPGLDFSADGRWLAVTLTQRQWQPVLKHTAAVHVYDRLSRECIHDISVDVTNFDRPAIARFVYPADEQVAILLALHPIGEEEVPPFYLWDYQAGANLIPLAAPKARTNRGRYAVSPNGRRLAVCESFSRRDPKPPVIRVYEMDGTLRGEFAVPWTAVVVKLAFSPSGRRLAVLARTHDGRPDNPDISGDFIDDSEATAERWLAILLDSSSGAVIGSLPHQQSTLQDVVMPNEETLVIANAGHALDVWQLGAERTQPVFTKSRTLHGHAAEPQIAVAPSGRWLGTASVDESVRQWFLTESPYSQEHRRALPIRSFPVPILTSSDGATLVANAADVRDHTLLEIIDVSSGNVRDRSIRGYPGWLSPDGHTLITLDYDSPTGTTGLAGYSYYDPVTMKAIQTWDLTTQPATLIKGVPFEKNIPWVTSGKMSQDGHWIIAGTAFGEVKLVHAPTGKIRSLPRKAEVPIGGVTLCPSNRYLAFAGRTAGIYDLESDEYAVLTSGREVISYPAFSPNGHWLAHSPNDGTIEIYHLSHGLNNLSIHTTLRGHQSSVRNLAFSPDGKTLVSTDRAQKLKFWHVTTWQEMGTLTSTWHAGFSLDGRHLYTDGLYGRDTHRGTLTIRTVPAPN